MKAGKKTRRVGVYCLGLLAGIGIAVNAQEAESSWYTGEIEWISETETEGMSESELLVEGEVIRKRRNIQPEIEQILEPPEQERGIALLSEPETEGLRGIAAEEGMLEGETRETEAYSETENMSDAEEPEGELCEDEEEGGCGTAPGTGESEGEFCGDEEEGGCGTVPGAGEPEGEFCGDEEEGGCEIVPGGTDSGEKVSENENTLNYVIEDQKLEAGKTFEDIRVPDYATTADGRTVTGTIEWKDPATSIVFDSSMKISGVDGEKRKWAWTFIPEEDTSYASVEGMVEITLYRASSTGSDIWKTAGIKNLFENSGITGTGSASVSGSSTAPGSVSVSGSSTAPGSASVSGSSTAPGSFSASESSTVMGDSSASGSSSVLGSLLGTSGISVKRGSAGTGSSGKSSSSGSSSGAANVIRISSWEEAVKWMGSALTGIGALGNHKGNGTVRSDGNGILSISHGTVERKETEKETESPAETETETAAEEEIKTANFKEPENSYIKESGQTAEAVTEKHSEKLTSQIAEIFRKEKKETVKNTQIEKTESLTAKTEPSASEYKTEELHLKKKRQGVGKLVKQLLIWLVLSLFHVGNSLK